MAPTKNLPTKTNYSALSKALRSNNTSLAIREISTVSVSKIMDAREYRADLVFELEQLRRSYKFIKNEVYGPWPKGGNPSLIALEKRGKELSDLIAETPEMPTLLELKSKEEEELLEAICLLIVNIIEYHTTTTDRMSIEMIKETATRIMYQFGGLTLEDIGLCFHQVKNGLMGKVYNRIDAAVIMNWLHQYEKDVRDIGEEKNLRLHGHSKGSTYKTGLENRLILPKRLKDMM